jgi:hypothetical protein
MNLTASSGKSSRRPHQTGRALGRKSGLPTAIQVDWLIDTGADYVTVQHSVGNSFDTVNAIGVTASPTTGGGGMQVVTGITTEFEVEDGSGVSHTKQSSKYVAIKSNNAKSNILGMEQLADAGASVRWDPSNKQGALTI